MSSEDDKNVIKVLINLLKFYDIINSKKNIEPNEFIKMHVCEMNLFIPLNKEITLKIFCELCLVRKLLHEICKDTSWPKTKSGIVHLYLMLFYLTSTNQNKILESVSNHFDDKIQKRCINFLQQPDLYETISKKCFKLYNSNKGEEATMKEYILKEVRDRLGLFNQLDKTMEIIKETKKLRSINNTSDSDEKVSITDLPINLSINLKADPKFFAKSVRSYKPMPSTRRSQRPHQKISLTDLANCKSPINEVNSEKDLETSRSETNLLNNLNENVSLSPKKTEKSELLQKGLKYKTTTTQVLRQALEIQKMEKETDRLVRDLCSGAKDPRTIQNLLEQIRESEMEFELRELERKHLLGQISLEEARLAKLEVQKSNHQKALKLRSDNKELEKILYEHQIEEEKRIRQLAEKSHGVIENMRLAQNKIIETKKQIVKTVKMESTDLANLKSLKKREELERKIALIRQIKQLENASKNIFKTVFNSSDLSIQRTCKMSEAQLTQELKNLKEKIRLENNMRNEKIKNEKSRQQKMMTDIKAKIKAHQELKISNEIKTNKIKKNLQLTPELIELRKKLHMKKLEVVRFENNLL